MNKIIYAPESLPLQKEETYVFLGGPIQGAPDWQSTVPEIQGITWINPRRKEKITGGLGDDEYSRQVEWETIGLRVSDYILFWIPEKVEDIPGRDYAQTTKIEFAENLVRRRGRNIIVGAAPGINGRRYIVEKAKQYGITQIYTTLEDCIDQLKKELRGRELGQYFTSDTHFGAERTLELSRRPFLDVSSMDWSIVERWNTKVPPEAIVWHLGDFGDRSFLRYLNGKVRLVCGNYETKERKDRNLDIPDFMDELMDDGFSRVYLSNASTTISITPEKDIQLELVHEPLKAPQSGYTLFGHIHGRQMIKKFGLDVGVDCHNFTPLSTEDVGFFLNALSKGYYDEEVFY